MVVAGSLSYVERYAVQVVRPGWRACLPREAGGQALDAGVKQRWRREATPWHVHRALARSHDRSFHSMPCIVVGLCSLHSSMPSKSASPA